jgi:branched-chain amino acid transport system substrate-binding protein
VAATRAFLPNAQKVAIVGPNDATGQTTAPPFRAAFSGAGYTVKDFSYPAATTDLSVVMTQVASFNPDLMFLGWAQSNWELAIPALTGAGIGQGTAIMAYGGTAASAPSFKGRPYIADPVIEADFSVANPTTEAKKFEERLKKLTGQSTLPPHENSAEFFYSSVLLLAKAMEKAGSVSDTAAIAKALTQVKVQGISGPVYYDSHNVIVTGLDFTFVANGTETTKHFS